MPYTFFTIVGPGDTLLYSREHPETKPSDGKLQLREFVMYAALDAAEEVTWSTSRLSLGVVDRYDAYHISSYVSPTHIRFLVMQDDYPRDNVSAFFVEAHETFTRYLLNPFHSTDRKIESRVFDEAMLKLMSKHF